MKVSAIMPTYNQAEFIQEALDSIVGQVDELIVVDDGSTDGTLLIVPHALKHWNNLGTAAAINTGFREATGDLVTWVSSDNIYAPNWRETLECEFSEDVGVVYSAFRHGLNGKVLFKPYDPGRLISNEACYIGPSFLIKRNVWSEAGDHRGKISHDYDHWLRVEEVCWSRGLTFVGVPESLCDYRIHNGNATNARRHEYDAPHWQKEARARRAP